MPSPAPPRPVASVLEMIGNTPMIEVTNIDTGPCRLFLKLESQNPGGSIKDRIGLSMIEAAEREGKIKPGGTIIEATAGNTGLGLALVAAQKGYRLVLVIPDKMSQEKIFHLRALGAEVLMTRSDVGKGHPEYYQDMAERIQRETPNSIWVDQFSNPANPEAHEKGTGPEIWAQLDGQVDALVAGVGSGGTITGVGRFLKSKNPQTQVIVADPVGSVVAEAANTGVVPEDVGSWVVEGIGEDFIPPNCDLSVIDRGITVSDEEALHTVREVLQQEGVIAGSSSGTLIAAALRYCREQTDEKRVVTFVCDSGNKYLSKVYNDYWMIDQGFIRRETHGDLRDVISRRAEEAAVVSVAPDDTLVAAYGRMKLYDVSQLPVLDKSGRLAGIIDETDILLQVVEDEARFAEPVSSAMTTRVETLPPTASTSELLPIFEKGMVGVVAEGGTFHGLITRIDLINYLRRRLRDA